MNKPDKDRIIEEFNEVYRKAYSNILPDEILSKGNKWFTDFIAKVFYEWEGYTDYLEEFHNKLRQIHVEKERKSKDE